MRLASPERLQPKPDAKSLQFGKHFTDHMLKIEYHVRGGGWQKPIICPLEYLSLHPAAKVLHYAIEVNYKNLFVSNLQKIKNRKSIAKLSN